MIDKLLQYQTIDAELKAIENTLRQSEEFKKYASAVKFLKTVAESKAQIESKAGALMGAMANLEEQLNKLNEEKAEFLVCEETQDESTIAFLKKKSNALAKQFTALEGEIAKLSQDMTELYAQYKKLMTNTKAMLAQQEESKKAYEDLSKSKEDEKKKIKKQLDALAKDIAPNIMEKYLEKRKDPKFPIVYELSGKHCSACGTELSQLELAKLKTERIAECENCRRLIFIKE